MGESSELPPKKDVMTALLEGASVFLHLDPRRQGVIVPKWLANQPQLILQVGLNMLVRIPDLEVGDDGVSCTLSFNRSPFWCFMPFTAIYGIVAEDGRGMIWPQDVPIELSQAPAARPRPHLEAVRALAPEPPDEDAAAKESAAAHASPGTPKKGRVQAAPKPKVAKPKAPRARPKLVDPPVAPVAAVAAVAAVAVGSEDSEIHEDPSPPSPPTKNTKRPLPPYLRVVK